MAFGVCMKKENDWIEIKARKVWYDMHRRCGKHTAYMDVSICQEWQEFDNFKSWFQTQVENGWYKDGWQIDKDIITKGGRVYSPDSCAFIPKPLNMLFVKAYNRRYKYWGTRGAYRILSSDQDGNYYNLFCATFSYDGKVIFYGEYDYELFSFFEYKFAFEEFVQNKAEELKENLNPKMYRALMDYRVLPMGY